MLIWLVLLVLKCACVAGEDKFQKEIDAMKAEVEKLKVMKEKKAAQAHHPPVHVGNGCDGSEHCMGFASWRRVATRRDPDFVSYLRQQAKSMGKDRVCMKAFHSYSCPISLLMSIFRCRRIRTVF